MVSLSFPCPAVPAIGAAEAEVQDHKVTDWRLRHRRLASVRRRCRRAIAAFLLLMQSGKAWPHETVCRPTIEPQPCVAAIRAAPGFCVLNSVSCVSYFGPPPFKLNAGGGRIGDAECGVGGRFSARADRRKAAAEGGGARRAAAAPDRPGRNAPRNRGSRGSPARRRNGNPARPDGPSASGRPCPTDRAGWSCRRSPGWAWPAPGGAAAQAGSAPADRRGPWRRKPPGPTETILRQIGRADWASAATSGSAVAGIGALRRSGRRGPRRAGARGLAARRLRRAVLAARALACAAGFLGAGAFFLSFAFTGEGRALRPKPVRLADHRIAADAAQFVGNLAGGRAAFPHLLQRSDPLVSPAHKLISCSCVRPCGARLAMLASEAAAARRSAMADQAPANPERDAAPVTETCRTRPTRTPVSGHAASP